MTGKEFLSDRLGRLALQAVFVAVTAVFLYATGTGIGIILLLLLIWFLIFLGVQITDFLQCRFRVQELEDIMNGLDEKYLFAECVPKVRNSYERKVMELSRKAGRAMIGAVSDAQAAQQEYREYVESWVHEVKTPITAAVLLCRSTEPKIRRKLSQELAQIEAQVERALFYARAESPEKDFLIRELNLAQIAASAIEQHRTLLIQNDIRIETEHLEQTVYTDEKWAVFILGQLLQNAARYRGENPVIRLTARQLGQQVRLIVQDNGIGIPEYELSRVFDRGFTGSNGRIRGGSTGMGLYLCRKLTACLEMDIQVTSVEGKETVVTLTFPAKQRVAKQ